MEIIRVTQENLDKEHICCSISDKKGESGVSSKKAWMTQCFPDGLVFKKLNVRGKVLIEYIPAESAWCPIDAGGYMHIHCLWISGQYKGQGYGNQLLEECIQDAKALGKKGITVLSSPKKMPFLSDPGFLKHKGFQVCDTAAPHFNLMYLPFDREASVPHFKECIRQERIEDKGLVLYYSNQCPFTDKYAAAALQIAGSHGRTLRLIRLEAAVQAQNAPTPFPTYSLFYNGSFVTNEILSEKKFEAFLDRMV